MGRYVVRQEARERMGVYLRVSTPSGEAQKWLASGRRGRGGDALWDATPEGPSPSGTRMGCAMNYEPISARPWAMRQPC